MKRLSIPMAIFAAVAMVSSSLSHGEEKNLPPDALKRVESFFEEKIGTRYMEKNCEPVEYPGWDGFPLLKCRYEVEDRGGVQKAAEVILLNPSPQQLARWVVFACLEVKGSADAEYTDGSPATSSSNPERNSRSLESSTKTWRATECTRPIPFETE